MDSSATAKAERLPAEHVDSLKNIETGYWWYVGRVQWAINLIRTTFPKRFGAMTYMDLGCGTGSFTALLSHLGHVTGVELSEQAIQQAQEKYPGMDFRSGSGFDVPLQNHSYDIVVMQEVIEHVDDQLGLIERCGELLADSGHLVLTTPNKTIVEMSGVQEKARQEGKLQPIENLLTIRQTRHLIGRVFDIVRCRTIIPTGSRGVLRLVNSSRLGQIPVWRSLRGRLPIGLHTVIVGRLRDRTEGSRKNQP